MTNEQLESYLSETRHYKQALSKKVRQHDGSQFEKGWKEEKLRTATQLEKTLALFNADPDIHNQGYVDQYSFDSQLEMMVTEM